MSSLNTIIAQYTNLPRTENKMFTILWEEVNAIVSGVDGKVWTKAHSSILSFEMNKNKKGVLYRLTPREREMVTLAQEIADETRDAKDVIGVKVALGIVLLNPAI